MDRETAIKTLTKRGLLGGSLESTVRTTLAGAYNHPTMQGTSAWEAAMTLRKEFGFTRFGNSKKATDRQELRPIPVKVKDVRQERYVDGAADLSNQANSADGQATRLERGFTNDASPAKFPRTTAKDAPLAQFQGTAV